MKSFITPLILIVAAGMIFFLYSHPSYTDAQSIQAETAEQQEALDRVQDLVELRNQLVTQRNAISSANLDRLNKLLPNQVDTVRVLIEINQIASEYGMSLEEIEFEEIDTESDSSSAYRALPFSFSVTGGYDDFLSFLSDVERSLRIIDVQSVEFGGDEGGDESEVESDIRQYRLQVQTYWLSQNGNNNGN